MCLCVNVYVAECELCVWVCGTTAFAGQVCHGASCCIVLLCKLEMVKVFGPMDGLHPQHARHKMLQCSEGQFRTKLGHS